MPDYTYKCKECGGYREDWYTMRDAPKVIDCPGCHGDMERIIHPVGIKFNGTGWAKDGYSTLNKESDD